MMQYIQTRSPVSDDPREPACKLTLYATRANAQMIHIHVQNLKKKSVLVMSLKCTPVTESILCLVFLMYEANIWCANYSGQKSKNILQFMILTHCDLETRSSSPE